MDRTDEIGSSWDSIASGYDKTNTPTQMWLGNECLQRAGLKAGMRFLDVAAGSGALSVPAARLGAEVVATDRSATMLALLEARAKDEGLALETRAMDGQALELEDESFDAAGSQFGVMLFEDMPKGIREMYRVVKPGGCVFLSAYGDPSQIDFLKFMVEAVQSVRPDFDGPPSDPPPLEFQLADPARLERELSSAGLRDVRVETITESTTFTGGDALWEWILWSNPIVEMILGTLKISPEEREVVRKAMGDLVRARGRDDGSIVLSNPVNLGVGRR